MEKLEPVSQRSDDQPPGVPQVLVAVLEVCVGLADDTVVFILSAKREPTQENQM